VTVDFLRRHYPDQVRGSAGVPALSALCAPLSYVLVRRAYSVACSAQIALWKPLPFLIRQILAIEQRA
jgi:hypothetical protein